MPRLACLYTCTHTYISMHVYTDKTGSKTQCCHCPSYMPSHTHARTHAHARTRTHTHNRLTALCPGLPRWACTRRNIHALISIVIIKHPLPTSSIYYARLHAPCHHRNNNSDTAWLLHLTVHCWL